ncbi:MAG: hypothetical protein LBP52_08470 [Burkholderiaceae bacterium]|jgi:hypothetical protein|nr:hypothetical protein [Burkholderiaceae bacterium]
MRKDHATVSGEQTTESNAIRRLARRFLSAWKGASAQDKGFPGYVHSSKWVRTLLEVVVATVCLAAYTGGAFAASEPMPCNGPARDPFDQVWRDEDYCWLFSDTSVYEVLTSWGGETDHWTFSGVVPQNAYKQHTIITNDLDSTVRVTYIGYEDTGDLAEYITGTIKGWTDVTLAPGESTAQFDLLFGMPWYISDPKSMNAKGDTFWTWKVEKVGASVPTAVPATGPMALLLLTLGIVGAGGAAMLRGKPLQ